MCDASSRQTGRAEAHRFRTLTHWRRRTPLGRIPQAKMRARLTSSLAHTHTPLCKLTCTRLAWPRHPLTPALSLNPSLQKTPAAAALSQAEMQARYCTDTRSLNQGLGLVLHYSTRIVHTTPVHQPPTSRGHGRRNAVETPPLRRRQVAAAATATNDRRRWWHCGGAEAS